MPWLPAHTDEPAQVGAKLQTPISLPFSARRRDGDAARDFYSRIKIGMVVANTPTPVPAAYYSFGGWKRSLFGDHYIDGMEGVCFHTRLKTMTSRRPSGIRTGAQFNFTSGKHV